MDISVVIPVYNEEGALPELYRALADTLDRLPQAAEIIFADDGSTDGSADRLDAIAETDPRVRVLHLSRNYGQTAALMAAIQNSTGAVIIPMDGDGQNDPADPIFGAAEAARVMGNLDLGDARALPGGIDRDEAVHLAVEPHVLDHLAPVGFQGTAIIVQWHAQQR